ncbi:MAG: hypothetical protein LUF30_03465 [Lachnospiraceae bacterium]|nr:hypothetical protein [Lachnospiraceae bacterium]
MNTKRYFFAMAALVCMRTFLAFHRAGAAVDYDFYIYNVEEGVTETPMEGNATIVDEAAPERSDDSEVPAGILYSYNITKTSTGVLNDYFAVTNWIVAYTETSTLTYTASVSNAVSSTITSSVTAGVDVPVATLERELGVSIGVSTTITASESVSYVLPAGYKGRIVMRYYRDITNFTWVKLKSGNTVSSGSGSVYGKARDPYYARQLISLS